MKIAQTVHCIGKLPQRTKVLDNRNVLLWASVGGQETHSARDCRPPKQRQALTKKKFEDPSLGVWDEGLRPVMSFVVAVQHSDRKELLFLLVGSEGRIAGAEFRVHPRETQFLFVGEQEHQQHFALSTDVVGCAKVKQLGV